MQRQALHNNNKQQNKTNKQNVKKSKEGGRKREVASTRSSEKKAIKYSCYDNEQI